MLFDKCNNDFDCNCNPFNAHWTVLGYFHGTEINNVLNIMLQNYISILFS